MQAEASPPERRNVMASGGGGGGQIVVGPGLTYVFSSPGTLTTTDNGLIPWIPGRNNTVDAATAQVKTPAPLGAPVVIDIKLIDRATGAVVSTLGTIAILAGSLVSAIPLIFAKAFVPDTQAVAIFITGVGSPGTEGTDLTVEVFKA